MLKGFSGGQWIDISRLLMAHDYVKMVGILEKNKVLDILDPLFVFVLEIDISTDNRRDDSVRCNVLFPHVTRVNSIRQTFL